MCWNFTFYGLCVMIYSVFGMSLCTYKRWWKWCPRASIQAWTHLILFSNTFCRSACEIFLMYTVIAVFNSLSVRGDYDTALILLRWGTGIFQQIAPALNELRTAITVYIRNISQADLQKVFANKIKRVQACTDARGHHFHHLF